MLVSIPPGPGPSETGPAWFAPTTFSVLDKIFPKESEKSEQQKSFGSGKITGKSCRNDNDDDVSV